MSSNKILLSLMHLISLIFYLLIGCGALLAAVNPYLRGQIEGFFMYAQTRVEPKVLLIFGSVFLLYGVVLLAILLVGFRHSYWHVALKGSKVMIDHSIIEEYIKGYFKTLFPKETPSLKVVFHPKQRLEIVTRFPGMHDVELLLQRIENELGVLLARKLGYQEEFIVTIQIPSSEIVK